MSAEYSTAEFLRDFHALWKNWPTLVTEYSHGEMNALIRAYFVEHYGARAPFVGDYHMKLMGAIGEYIDQWHPEISTAVENIPDSLATAIFFLVDEGKIQHPTREQVELMTANLAPRK